MRLPRPTMPRSMRARLILAVSAITAGMLALQGVATYIMVRHQLLSAYDAGLLVKARALAASVEVRNDRPHIELDPQDMPEFSARNHAEYFEVWFDGIPASRSPSLHGGDLPQTGAEVRASMGSLRLPGSRRGRAVVLDFSPKDEADETPARKPHRCTVTVAGRPDETLEALELLNWLLGAECAAVIVLSGAVLARAVTRGLQPVRSLARDIERIGASALSSRLDATSVPPELSPVVLELNRLLARLEQAFGREKSFTADVAHELRTPLFGLITTLDVCRARPREPLSYEASIDQCREILDRMREMIENLLLLARADTTRLPLSVESVDVGTLLRESWTAVEQGPIDRGVSVQFEIADDCHVESDVSKLRIVIHNLLDNATSYVDDNGSIEVRCRSTAEEVEVEVVNTGSHLSESDVDKVFERFWRGEASRTDTGRHCGLGLSIAHRLCEVLGGRLQVRSSTGGGFVATVLIPKVFCQNQKT